MNTSNDATCGSGCDCKKGPSPTPLKWIVSGVVVAAAIALAAKQLTQKQTDGESNFAAFPEKTAVQPAPGGVQGESTSWGVPLEGLSKLNTLAASVSAVFVLVPGDDEKKIAEIKREVEDAKTTIEKRGLKIACYVLSKTAPDYEPIAAQIGSPSVLALVKGAGMATAAKTDLTQDGLMKAYISASRPRTGGCGTGGGCGPSGCN